jgi:hypothetical protein
VFASVTDGLGTAELSLHVIRLDTMEQIYSRTNQVRFPNTNAILNVYYPVRNCAFPDRGWYQATLLVDGEWVAQRRVYVHSQESAS